MTSNYPFRPRAPIPQTTITDHDSRIVMEKAPEGLLHLTDVLKLPNGSIVSFMGVVCSYLPAARSQGSDWTMAIELKDQTLCGNARFKVRFFGKPEFLHQNVSVGDVLLGRNVKMSNFRNDKVALTSYGSCTILFPSTQIPAPEFRLEYASGDNRLKYHFKGAKPVHDVTVEEQFYAMGLRHWSLNDFLKVQFHNIRTERTASRVKGGSESLDKSGPQHNRRFSLVKDIVGDKFSDLVVEVVKIFSNQYESMEIYVTDYTPNSLLFDYVVPGDTENQIADEDMENSIYQRNRAWQGPYGKLTLQVKVWDPHCQWVRENVQEGDIVLIRNVHVKYVNTGLHQILAASLHQDKDFPAQVDVRRIDMTDERVIKLANRKGTYEGQLRKTLGQATKPKKKSNKGKKNKKGDGPQNTENVHGRLDPKMSPIMRKGARRRSPSGSDRANQDVSRSASLNPPQSKPTHTPSNPHVTFSTMDLPVSNFHYLEDVDRSFVLNGKQVVWPYTNQRVHARIRVLDYKPDDLTQFSYHRGDPNWQTDGNLQQGKYDWYFCLCVCDESVPERERYKNLNLWVGGPDATMLLGMEPCDLSANPEKLLELKEKLFILWGNCEELKSQGKIMPDEEHSSTPFDCGIQEYGILVEDNNDWSRAKRHYGIWGTKIQL